MKNILIPTDFSSYASAACDLGIQLAAKSGAKIEFLHLMTTPVDWVKLSLEKEKKYPETKKQIGHAKSELHQLVKKAGYHNVQATHALIFNRNNTEIFSEIKQHDCDMIIMGSKGTSGLKEILIGSNAQQLIRKATVPVLVIKKPITKAIKNILFVSDFKDVTTPAFHKLTQFADEIEAPIHLLFVNTPDGFKETSEVHKNMDSFLEHRNRKENSKKNIVDTKTVEAGIDTFISENPTDLIAICTHGKSILEQLFKPSIAEHVVNHSELPVLSIRL